VTLVVFFSRGMSFEGWRKAGILDREMALYRALLPRLDRLVFVTYGGPNDHLLVSHLPGVTVLPNRWRLPSNVYSVLAPVLHWRTLRTATVFKTNQLNGAWSAVLAQRLFRKKLFVRCGFLWADFVGRLHPDSWRHTAAVSLERQACRAADVVVVAAAADREAIVDRYELDIARVHVNPNYVESDLFRPGSGADREPGHVLFVGRLDEQKNIRALVTAVVGIPGCALTVVGDGPLHAELTSLAQGPTVTFLGRRPHRELPVLMRRASVFVMPSHYEGHPKALLEAMASGMAVIGARSPGIREVVSHDCTGMLCGTSPEEIASTLTAVLADADLRQRLGAAARAYVLETCTLDAAVEREWRLLSALVGNSESGHRE
jgi:glycosyltransferase involved in cell wall biosynthesis